MYLIIFGFIIGLIIRYALKNNKAQGNGITDTVEKYYKRPNIFPPVSDVKKTEIDKNLLYNTKRAIDLMGHYYCYECGAYIEKNTISWKCPNCGAPKIGMNTENNLLNSFFEYGIGGFIYNLSSKPTMNDMAIYSDYYNSEYYKSTKIVFENVIIDKGKVGEYTLEKQINVLKRRGLSVKILFNAIIPEPNGSFQEIDAIAIVGGNIFVIENKNRTGHFEIPSPDSKEWYLRQNGTETKIYSPILQNEQHLAALTHYLTEKNIYYNNIFSVVCMGGMATYNIQHEPDLYASVLFGERTIICSIGVLTNSIYDLIQNEYKEWYKQIEIKYLNRINDKTELEKCVRKETNKIMYAQEDESNIYNNLVQLTQIPDYKRQLYMRERDMRSDEFMKSNYQYYYLKGDMTHNGMLVRTNGVYNQYNVILRSVWQDASAYADNIENVSWLCEGDDFSAYEKIVQLHNPIEVAEAALCILNHEEYIPKERGSIVEY